MWGKGREISLQYLSIGIQIVTTFVNCSKDIIMWRIRPTYLFNTPIRKTLTVRSIDLICTFNLDAIGGAVAFFKGLNERTVFTILLAIDERVRTRTPRQFKVALMRMASLRA